MATRSPQLLVIEAGSDQAPLSAAVARGARSGLSVYTAQDSPEGIAYLAGLPPFDDRGLHAVPDLILLDPVVPEADGLEVLTWIRNAQPELDVPVVVVTASSSTADSDRAQALGAREVHRKPEDLDELSGLVRSIIDRWIGVSQMIGAHLGAMG